MHDAAVWTPVARAEQQPDTLPAALAELLSHAGPTESSCDWQHGTCEPHVPGEGLVGVGARAVSATLGVESAAGAPPAHVERRDPAPPVGTAQRDDGRPAEFEGTDACELELATATCAFAQLVTTAAPAAGLPTGTFVVGAAADRL